MVADRSNFVASRPAGLLGVALLCALGMAATASADTVSLSPDLPYVTAQHPVVLSVDLDAPQARSGLQFALTFPAGPVLIDSVMSAGRALGFSGTDAEVGAGHLSGILFDASGPGSISAGSGPVVDIHLRLDGAPGDTVRFEVAGALVADAAYQAVTPALAGTEIVLVSSLAVDEPGPTAERAPARFALLPCRPNPMRTSTLIEYTLPSPSPVSLRLYDLSGRVVRTLVRESQKAGRWSVSWDGRSDEGQLMRAGMYFCRIHAGSFLDTRPIVLVR